jgi:Domain of unknown function (DUF5668)/Cell wall-active antibiotics response 4TMS YvqF
MIYRNRSRRGFIVGLIILAIGLVLLLDQQGIVSAQYVFRFIWPAVFIFFGLEMLISCKCAGGRGLIGVLVLGFGLLLLAGSLGFLHTGIHTLWPVLLIIWGVWVVARAFGPDQGLGTRIRDSIRDSVREQIHDSIHENLGGENRPPQSQQDFADNVKKSVQGAVKNWVGEQDDAEFDYMAIFGGIKQRVTVKNFRGGRLTAVCGGFEVDLTRADIDGQTAVIDASALLGGGEIRVPPTWVIEIRGVALLGAYTDETHQDVTDAASAKRLIVKGMAALGGVVIKN